MSTAAQAKTHVYAQPIVVDIRVAAKALAIREADGRYSILVPELPGCVSQGDTIEEARANIVEAAEGWLVAGHDENRERAFLDATTPLPGEGSP